MSLNNTFWRITLDTNPDFCNLHCVMCEDHSPYADDIKTRKQRGRLRPIMAVSLLEKAIREAAALGFKEVIPSTMGEPLLYPYFSTFLSLCRELDLKLNLTTNGTFPGREKQHNVEYWAHNIVPVASDVKISWNGASDKTQKQIMQGTNLQQHIDNTRRFIAVRDELARDNYCSITMQLTFMRSNLYEIIDMVKLAISLGFDRIKGHHLWTHFSEIEQESLRNDIRFANKWNQIVRQCKDIVDKHNLHSDKQVKLDNFFELDVNHLEDIAPDGECPFLGKEIWVDPGGRFNVCCAPDQQRKALGDFGNLNHQTIAEIMDSQAYAHLQNNYHQYTLCKSCNMRRPR